MNIFFSKSLKKLYYQKWIIGICRGNIEEIIRSKTFDPDIKWLNRNSINKIYGDPFLVNSRDQNIKILLEELKYEGDNGKIVLMTLDKTYRMIDYKILLDIKSHLSYPFVYQEQNKTFVFPESSKSGKLSCYEYDFANESLSFVKDILELPLLDSTIIKHNDKYWIFGTIAENGTDYKLLIFFSDNLQGPYVPHPDNPVKRGLDGTRSAGKFIEVGGVVYRPSQNCKNEYGESITINTIKSLSETNFEEEPYMTICINKENVHNKGMYKIHTMNVMDNFIVVDGKHWSFAPFLQLNNYLKNHLR